MYQVNLELLASEGVLPSGADASLVVGDEDVVEVFASAAATASAMGMKRRKTFNIVSQRGEKLLAYEVYGDVLYIRLKANIRAIIGVQRGKEGSISRGCRAFRRLGAMQSGGRVYKCKFPDTRIQGNPYICG